MSDTLPSIDDCDGNDLVLGPVGDDTLFGGGDWPEEEEPDTETIIYGGKLYALGHVSPEEPDTQGNLRLFAELVEVRRGPRP